MSTSNFSAQSARKKPGPKPKAKVAEQQPLPTITTRLERYNLDKLVWLFQHVDTLPIPDDKHAQVKAQLLGILDEVSPLGTYLVPYMPYEYDKDERRGRLQARGGMQSMWKVLRSFLAAESYFDVDIGNSAPTLSQKVFGDLEIEHGVITDYVQNRDEHLTKLREARNCSRDEAKQLYNMVMNGSSQPRGNLTPEFLRFYTDMHRILTQLWERGPERLKKLIDPTSANKEGTLMAYMYFEIERQALDIIVRELERRGLVVSTLIFDGCHVEKAGCSEADLRTALNDIEKVLSRRFQVDLNLEIKPMAKLPDWLNMPADPFALPDVHFPTPVDELLERFEARRGYVFKHKMEAYVVLARVLRYGFRFVNDERGGHYEICQWAQYGKPASDDGNAQDTRCIQWLSTNKPAQREFLIHMPGRLQETIWFDRATRDDQSFVLNHVKSLANAPVSRNITFCPLRPVREPQYGEDFNIFSGFKAANALGNVAPRTHEQLFAKVGRKAAIDPLRPILDHIKHSWCGGNDELNHYVLSWFRQIALGEQTQVALVCAGPQGSGKNCVESFFRNFVLGKHCSKITAGMSQVLHRFNANMLKGSTFITINELSSLGGNDDYHAKFDMLKAILDQEMLQIEEKGIPIVEIANYVNLLMVTNGEYAMVVKIERTDRRYCVLHCVAQTNKETDPDGTLKYMERLWACHNTMCGELFYEYLMTLPNALSLRQLQNIPNTDIRERMKDASKSPVDRFVEEVMEGGQRYRNLIEGHKVLIQERDAAIKELDERHKAENIIETAAVKEARQAEKLAVDKTYTDAMVTLKNVVRDSPSPIIEHLAMMVEFFYRPDASAMTEGGRLRDVVYDSEHHILKVRKTCMYQFFNRYNEMTKMRVQWSAPVFHREMQSNLRPGFIELKKASVEYYYFYIGTCEPQAATFKSVADHDDVCELLAAASESVADDDMVCESPPVVSKSGKRSRASDEVDEPQLKRFHASEHWEAVCKTQETMFGNWGIMRSRDKKEFSQTLLGLEDQMKREGADDMYIARINHVGLKVNQLLK